MGELLEVREYETIVGNKEYKDQYRCMDKGTFADLIEFIHAFDSEEEKMDILDFIKIGYKRNLGETVTFKNYVGLIQMKNSYQIQVLPKIEFAKGKKDETKQVFMKMLRSMKDFHSKVFTNANLKMDRMNLYEIFINMYLQEVRKLVKHGIKSSYVEQEGNLTVFKGKLLVNEHIKQNMAHKERFYVGFDEYQVNRAENRLVKSTLLKLQKITGSAENSKEIRRLLTAFELVEPSINYDKDFSNDKGSNYGISQADMYQMYAYSKKYGTSEIWLLYPVNDAMRGCGPIKFDSGDGATVSLFFVDVTDIERSMEELLNSLMIKQE